MTSLPDLTHPAHPSAPAAPPFELGLYSFGPTERQGRSPHQQLSELIEQAVLAEQVGLDVFGIGEHHRPDYLISSPVVLLSAMAARTRRLRLTSAVSVLGSEDPVRLFQTFANLDVISGGRAEIMAGRGSFAESFPLFLGGMPSDYDGLFAEKLDLLLQLRQDAPVTWQGRSRPPLEQARLYPRPVQAPLPVWLAVGGTPSSAVRAGQLGLPMALAIIGGRPEHFAPVTALYKRSWAAAGHAPGQLRLSINSHGFVADTSQAARDLVYPGYAEAMNQLGRERGWSPLGRAQFDASTGPGAALVVGDPEQVAEKIVYEHELFGHHRFLMQMDVGVLPHAQLLRSIELFGTRVAPMVRQALERTEPRAVRPSALG